MEVLLNLTWMVLAAVIVGLWFVHSPREVRGRRGQVIALVMLILVLFPVISVSDDLQVAQNLAEEDAYLRRACASALHDRAHLPVVAMLLQSVLMEMPVAYICFHGLSILTADIPDNPALLVVQNRPPPIG